MARATDHQQGILLAGSGVFVLSFDALLVRLSAAAGADITFWRGTLVLLCAGLICLLQRRQIQWPSTPRLWFAAIGATVLYGVNSALFVFSINNTTAANTVVILASSPLFAAAISWLALGEKTPKRTLGAIAFSVLGVLIVFSTSLGSPGQLGDLLALILAFSMGLTLTLLRRFAQLPRLPMVAGSGLVAALICWPFAAPLQLPAQSYLWLAIMGLAQIPLATLLIFSATRHLPAAEVSLFLLIETILGPVWVWLVVDETLPAGTLVGGSLIVASIAVNALLALRQQTGTLGNG